MRSVFQSIAIAISSCSIAVAQQHKDVQVSLDLKNIINDKVQVSIEPPAFTENTTTFYIPKIVPGTYSEDNYGKFIDDFKAFDKKGNEIAVEHSEDNSWK